MTLKRGWLKSAPTQQRRASQRQGAGQHRWRSNCSRIISGSHDKVRLTALELQKAIRPTSLPGQHREPVNKVRSSQLESPSSSTWSFWAASFSLPSPGPKAKQSCHQPRKMVCHFWTAPNHDGSQQFGYIDCFIIFMYFILDMYNVLSHNHNFI